VQRGEQVVNNARTKTEDTTGTTRQLPRGRRRSWRRSPGAWSCC